MISIHSFESAFVITKAALSSPRPVLFENYMLTFGSMMPICHGIYADALFM